jgi:hypothetical protein
MTLNKSETASGDADLAFKNVGENLYRHAPSGNYYALLRRGGKQFRRSLKTDDRALANRRLSDLRKKIANLTFRTLPMPPSRLWPNLGWMESATPLNPQPLRGARSVSKD